MDHEAELTDAEQEAAMEKWQSGPFAFVSYRSGATMSMGVMYGMGAGLCVLAAAFLTLLVLRAKNSSFGARFAMCFCAFVVVAVLGPGQNWLYWSFPTEYVLPQLIDLGVQGILAGIVIGAFAK